MADINLHPSDLLQQAQNGKFASELKTLQKQGLTSGNVEKDAELLGLSYEFEKILMSQMLKAMRETVETDGLFGKSLGGDMYHQMLDTEILNNARGTMNLGLASSLYRQFINMEGPEKTTTDISA